jgi:7,8-dihydropterin-6-yl-methyl-4-(beta-D-ribofuranosyl)aminobenzene 5'-phosphate synthase
LKTFLGLNSAARAYLHKEAFGGHFADRPGGVRAYIGLDKMLRSNERLIFCGDYLKIDEELEIFSAVSGNLHSPSGNADLLRYESGKYEADDFRHEQNLIISENGRYCLITGCAHRGIINIIDRFREIKGRSPDYVVGGFHMYNKSRGESEAPEIVKEIGGLLAGYDNVSYHTCHCTGTEAYNALKNVMGGRISHISTGNKIIF